MVTERHTDQPQETRVRLPQPVEGGTEHIESLGRFIDDLMGDSRRRERIRRESAGMFMDDDKMSEDPPPSEPPPSVPDGTDVATRGGRSDVETTVER
jgi:hypothetical protein